MEQSSIPKSLAFDDILIRPARSSVLPNSVITGTKITKNIELGIPLISSAMDTVTEYKLAITIAQAGGMGILHKNMSIEDQSQNVRKVKKFETGNSNEKQFSKNKKFNFKKKFKNRKRPKNFSFKKHRKN